MAGTLTGPFSAVVDKVVTNPWLRKFLDLECFVLSGMTAKDTICAGTLPMKSSELVQVWEALVIQANWAQSVSSLLAAQQAAGSSREACLVYCRSCCC